MTKAKTSKSNKLYQVGDRVFAKLKGYPWWPARIESVENQSKPLKYKILFYATYEINLIKPDCLVPFNKESIEKYGEKRKYKYFNEAMDEIQNDPELKNFSQQNESENSPISESSDDQSSNLSRKNSENNDSNEYDETEKIDVEKHSTERSTSDLESKTESEKSFKSSNQTESNQKSKKNVTKANKIKKKSKNDSKEDESQTKSIIEKMDVGDCEGSKSAKSNSDLESQSNVYIKASKRSIEDDFDYKSISAKTRRITSDDEEDGKIEEVNKKEIKVSDEFHNEKIKLKQISQKNNQSKNKNSQILKEKKMRIDKSDKNHEENRISKGDTKFESEQAKLEKCLSLNKMSDDEKEARKQKLKEKKILEKKLSKLKNIKIQIALQRMSMEIKKSLREENLDTERCCLLMQDFIKLPFSQKNLFKASEIVETIHECKNFKKSEKIKQKAHECCSKFLAIFSFSSEDTFCTFFEKERVKYLADNEDEVKKEKIISQKLVNSRTNLTKHQISSKANIELKSISVMNESVKIDKSCMSSKEESDQILIESLLAHNKQKDINQNSRNEDIADKTMD